METKDKKTNKNRTANKESVKDRLSGWIHKSPRLEAFVENSSYYIKHPEKFTEKVNEVYNRATNNSGEKPIGEFAGKIKSLFRMVKLSLSGEYTGIPKGKVIFGLVALTYLVSPVDIFPNFLGFLGFADEAALMLWLIKNADEELSRFEQWESTQGAVSSSPAY